MLLVQGHGSYGEEASMRSYAPLHAEAIAPTPNELLYTTTLLCEGSILVRHCHGAMGLSAINTLVQPSLHIPYHTAHQLGS